MNAASDIFYSRPLPKGSRLGQDPSWKCFSLLGNGATSGFIQREQASPYICGIFLLNLVEKTKRFYRKFYAFFFCQIMVKTKPKNVFTKNSMLLFVSFLFFGEDFSHFCCLLFCRNLLHLGAHVYGSLCGVRKKIFLNKVLTKICRIFILFHKSACKIKLQIPVICCNPPFILNPEVCR